MSHKLIKIALLILIVLGTFLTSHIALAEDPPATKDYYKLFNGVDADLVSIPIGDKPTATEILDVTNKGDLFRKIFNMILGFVGMIAMGMIVMAGYYYITAQGEEGQIDKAKKMIVAAVIGMLVVTAAYTLVATVLGLGADAGNPFASFFSNYW